MDDDLCDVCAWLPIYAKGRCEPCYRWLRRKGYDRPVGQVIQYGETSRSRRKVARILTQRRTA